MMIFWISIIVGVVIASVIWFHSRGISLERDRRRFLSRLTTASHDLSLTPIAPRSHGAGS